MNLSLKLAGISISIDFLGKTGRLLSFYNYAYQRFLSASESEDAHVTVRCLNVLWNDLLFREEEKDPAHVRLVPSRKLATWIDSRPDLYDSLAIEPYGIAVKLLNGLLIYAPDRSEGHILLSSHDDKPYRPLYHLLWIFFSQVLGDRRACFVHAAGVQFESDAVLFLGGSGEGKSTVAGLCRKGRVFSDDSPILCGKHDGYRIFPSPVHQLDPESAPGNAMAPNGGLLKKIFFLRRDDKNVIQAISYQQAFSIIMTRNIHFFEFLSESARVKLFELFYDICRKTSVAYLHFRRNADIESFVKMNGLEGLDVEFG